MPTPHSARGAGPNFRSPGGTLIRKTSLQDRTDGPLRSSNRADKRRTSSLRITLGTGSARRQRLAAADDARNDLLFTMSDITRPSHSHEIRAQEIHYAGDRELMCLDEPICHYPPSLKLRRAAFCLDWLASPKLRGSEGWWSQTGSNRRPPACKAGALPAELWPRKSGSAGLPTEARG